MMRVRDARSLEPVGRHVRGRAAHEFSDAVAVYT